MKRLLLAVCLLWMPAAITADDSLPSFRAGGLLFGDFYTVPSHHSEEGDGASGFVLRRGYLTFDANFTKNWFGRLRLELNQAGEFETYTFKTSFKDLYLGWNLGRQTLLLGLSPPPTFDLIESIWDYRYLVRTPLDLHGVASRDNGVSVKGPINASGTVSYRAMLGLEVDFGNETDDGRKWMWALTWKPSPKWTIDLYTDHEQLTGPTDRTTLQAFVAYQSDRLTWGAQYSHQDREEDPTLEVASAFARGRVGEKTRLVGRIDRLIKPSPKGDNISYLPFDPSAPATTLFAGVEFQPSPHLFVTPNAVVTYYDRNDEGVRPETDLHLRLTLFINFE
jgi:hypothetical protein